MTMTRRCDYCSRELYIATEFGTYCIFHYGEGEFESDQEHWLLTHRQPSRPSASRLADALREERVHAH